MEGKLEIDETAYQAILLLVEAVRDKQSRGDEYSAERQYAAYFCSVATLGYAVGVLFKASEEVGLLDEYQEAFEAGRNQAIMYIHNEWSKSNE